LIQNEVFEVFEPNEERIDVRIHDTASREVEKFEGGRWGCGMVV
jgi:hypothetical protein